jgi:uncharacterized membrane protein
MNTWTLLLMHVVHPALWLPVILALVVASLLIVARVAGQSYLGGRPHGQRDPLKNRYVRGEITMEEYWNRKAHVVGWH